MKAMPPVCETNVHVLNAKGPHLHVASLIARAATQFACDVTLVKGEIRANGKSVMSITLLAAPRGTELELICDGDDAATAVEQLAQLFADRFDAP